MSSPINAPHPGSGAVAEAEALIEQTRRRRQEVVRQFQELGVLIAQLREQTNRMDARLREAERRVNERFEVLQRDEIRIREFQEALRNLEQDLPRQEAARKRSFTVACRDVAG